MTSAAAHHSCPAGAPHELQAVRADHQEERAGGGPVAVERVQEAIHGEPLA
jgi:hypothetical protein